MKFLIIIPTHNEEQNISFCLNSLQNQIFQNFECIVVNDGSTDKSILLVVNTLFEANNIYSSLSNYTDDVRLFPMDDFLIYL